MVSLSGTQAGVRLDTHRVGDDSTFAMIPTARRSLRCALPLVIPVMLSLVACQRAGAIQRVRIGLPNGPCPVLPTAPNTPKGDQET